MKATPPAYEHLRYGCRTDAGRQRETNEDSLLCLPDHGVFVVADGMGGAQAGEVASRLSVDAVQNAFAHYHDRPGMNNLSRKRIRIRAAANNACRRIQEIVLRDGLSQSGSTLAALCFDTNQPDSGMCLHAGDSRIYRVRKGAAEQLTRDHAFRPGQPGGHGARFGVLTRAVGVQGMVSLEETRFDIAPGDIFLLCSDGFSNMVRPAQMSAVFANGSSAAPGELAGRLVQAANARGGVDNISVVVVRVEPGEIFLRPRAELAEPASDDDTVNQQAETVEITPPAVPDGRPAPHRSWRSAWVAGALLALAAVAWLALRH